MNSCFQTLEIRHKHAPIHEYFMTAKRSNSRNLIKFQKVDNQKGNNFKICLQLINHEIVN